MYLQHSKTQLIVKEGFFSQFVTKLCFFELAMPYILYFFLILKQIHRGLRCVNLAWLMTIKQILCFFLYFVEFTGTEFHIDFKAQLKH